VVTQGNPPRFEFSAACPHPGERAAAGSGDAGDRPEKMDEDGETAGCQEEVQDGVIGWGKAYS